MMRIVRYLLVGALAAIVLAPVCHAGDYMEIPFVEAGPLDPGVSMSFTPLANTKLCDALVLAGSFTGDSLRWYVDYSWDGNTFWLHDSATVVSGSDVWNRIVLTKTIGAGTYALDGIVWPYTRVRVKNASAVDTLTDISLILACRK